MSSSTNVSNSHTCCCKPEQQERTRCAQLTHMTLVWSLKPAVVLSVATKTLSGVLMGALSGGISAFRASVASAKDAVYDVVDDAKDAVGDVVDDVTDAIDDAKDAVGDVVDDVTDAIDDAKDAVGDVVDDVTEVVEDAYVCANGSSSADDNCCQCDSTR
jgi:methyl-accepting chemotaxis protein